MREGAILSIFALLFGCAEFSLVAVGMVNLLDLIVRVVTFITFLAIFSILAKDTPKGFSQKGTCSCTCLGRGADRSHRGSRDRVSAGSRGVDFDKVQF